MKHSEFTAGYYLLNLDKGSSSARRSKSLYLQNGRFPTSPSGFSKSSHRARNNDFVIEVDTETVINSSINNKKPKDRGIERADRILLDILHSER